MPVSPHLVFDRYRLRMMRVRHAQKALQNDFLHREIADRLWERLEVVKKDLPVVVCHGGLPTDLSSRLEARPGTSVVVTFDTAESIAAHTKTAVVADAEFLPLAAHAVDGFISCLDLQWVNDVPGALAQIRQCLRPDGLFMAALLGGDSLFELRQSFMEAELAHAGGTSLRVAPFIDVRDMGGLLQRAGFSLPVVDVDRITIDYASPLHLMRDLHDAGAGNAMIARRKSFLPRVVFLDAARRYQEKFGKADGRVTATFDVLFVIGWAPHVDQPAPLKPGSAKVRLADILHAKEVTS